MTAKNAARERVYLISCGTVVAIWVFSGWVFIFRNEKTRPGRAFFWRAVQGSNLRPVVLETTALPTELTTLAPESVARA